jgi:hypothetical protein
MTAPPSDVQSVTKRYSSGMLASSGKEFRGGKYLSSCVTVDNLAGNVAATTV